jgi:molybdopterin/thiamine biosynthesis adenylyltransferase
MSTTELSDEQLSRYSRHLLLPEIDLAGQIRLKQAKAVIVGAGGLGSPAAMYLASSGIGHLTIVDDDMIDLGNLQRQIAFRNSDINHPKAKRLREALLALNPDIHVEAVCKRADGELLSQLAANADILLDCCDNFASRFAINQASLETKTPLVSGAAIRFQGQVSVFDPRLENSPCYRCLYHQEADSPQETCSDRGIFAPLVGIIGSIQAAEAIKILLNIGQPLAGQLLTIDALSMTPRQIKLPKDSQCPACGAAKSA